MRQTQSFIRTLSAVWHRPALPALEILWRWTYGIPALALVFWQGHKALAAATSGSLDPAALGLDHALLSDPVGALTADPMGAVTKFGSAFSAIWAQARHPAAWLVPLLVLGWILAATFGRSAVLRRFDPTLHRRLGTLLALTGLRQVVLCAVFFLWLRWLGWDASLSVQGPLAHGTDPNLLLYCALLIIGTLVLFLLWSAVSWWFGLAPLLAMRQGTGAAESLSRAARAHGVRGPLVEINLVQGIVKIALLVLLMVFSATPLPFQGVTTPTFLAGWWVAVTLVYFGASDLFHVTRALAYLEVGDSVEPVHGSDNSPAAALKSVS